VSEPGQKINAGDKIEHNGNQITFEKRHYVMLNKPRGYVCTSDDPFAKKKAIDLVQISGARPGIPVCSLQRQLRKMLFLFIAFN